MTTEKGTNFFGNLPGSSTVFVALSDERKLALYAKCTGIPPTTSDIFSHGCIMVRTDTATGTPAIFENIGSVTSPSWQFVGQSANAAYRTYQAFITPLPAPTGANQNGLVRHVLKAPVALTMVSAYIISGTATVGSDANNQYTFQFKNATSGVSLSSASVGTNTAELAVDTAKALVIDQNLSVAANDILTLNTDILDDAGAGPTSLATANLRVVITYTI